MSRSWVLLPSFAGKAEGADQKDKEARSDLLPVKVPADQHHAQDCADNIGMPAALERRAEKAAPMALRTKTLPE